VRAAPPAEYDVVIVGGGVSGLYAAYQLRNAGKRVLLLERQPRVGGRVVTEERLGHILEYGPMRFEADLHPAFDKLVREELALPLHSFAPYTCPRQLPDLNAVTYEETRAIHESAALAPAFALLQHGLRLVLGEQWDVLHDDVRDPTRAVRKAWLRRHGLFQGRPLYAVRGRLQGGCLHAYACVLSCCGHLDTDLSVLQHGIWDTLAHVLSRAALDFLQQKGTFYHVLHLNPNAADTISFMLDVLATARAALVTVEGGSYRIVDALLARVRATSTAIRLDARVAALREAADGRVLLELDDGSMLAAHHVLLTCQQSCLKQLRGMPAELAPLLDAVMVVSLFKIFVILHDPPFSATDLPCPNFGADKVPCREIHYAYNTENNTGMIMVRAALCLTKHACFAECARHCVLLLLLDLRRRAEPELLERVRREGRLRGRHAAKQRERAPGQPPHVLPAVHLQPRGTQHVQHRALRLA
jgi:phytoene dehydrogenase-like protein